MEIGKNDSTIKTQTRNNIDFLVLLHLHNIGEWKSACKLLDYDSCQNIVKYIINYKIKMLRFCFFLYGEIISQSY